MRLFVGMGVPELPGLALATASIAAAWPGARLAESHHVTLRFLGEVGDAGPVAERLADALHDATATPGQVRGVGAFPHARRARVLWAGVEAAGLAALAACVVDATRGIGQKPEGRAFVPHVTLARLDGRDATAWIAGLGPADFGRAPFSEVTLYQSVAVGGRTRHEAVRRFPLAPPAQG